MKNLSELSEALRNAVTPELDFGEEIIWLEKPRPDFLALGNLFGVGLGAGFIWAGFIPTIYAPVPGADPASPGTVFMCLLFILMGFWMLQGVFWSILRALNSAYVITNRRAIIVEGGRTFTIRSFSPDQLADVYRREDHNGFGDLIFGQEIWTDSENELQRTDFGFLGIAGVRNSEQRLREMVTKAKAESECRLSADKSG